MDEDTIRREEAHHHEFIHHRMPKHVSLLKVIAFLIPILIIFYLFYANFIVSQEFNYFYDIGNGKENYLAPAERVSTSDVEQGTRNLTSSLVYFDVPIPRGSESITIQTRVKDVFENSSFRIGAKDREEWHYSWENVYNPVLLELEDYYSNGKYIINPDYVDGVENAVIASDKVVNQKINSVEDYEGNTFIDTSLRGAHTFYIYASGNLKLNIEKQDINWYNGSDELNVYLYDLNDSLIANLSIEDDGIVEVDKKQSDILHGEMNVDNLPEGVYKLVFTDFDGLIRKIEINTGKIVAFEKLYLADSDIFAGIENKENRIRTSFNRPGELSFRTWHSAGFQNLRVDNEIVNVNRTTDKFIFNALPRDYEIIIPKNDLIVEAPGYFSFTEESYFEPFTNRVLTPQYDRAWILNNLDVLDVESSPVMKEEEWLIVQAAFNISELHLTNNKLNMILNAPHLTEENSGNQIPIDWINITIYKPGVRK